MEWKTKRLEEMTPLEVFSLLQVRSAVFVVEQECPYVDPDELDPQSVHIWGEEEGAVAACCRITPPGTRFPEVSIGRVLTAQSRRGAGHGRELMKRALEHIRSTAGAVPVRISAQAYLRRFYEEFGFHVVSGEYLEENIPHYEMLRE